MLIAKPVATIMPHESTQLSGPRLGYVSAQEWLGAPPAGSLAGVFDSWAWTNRKWLALGGVGLVLAAIGTALTGGLK